MLDLSCPWWQLFAAGDAIPPSGGDQPNGADETDQSEGGDGECVASGEVTGRLNALGEYTRFPKSVFSEES